MPLEGRQLLLTDPQLERYARHIVLREIGGAGQQTLLGARVLVVGAGGLGTPLIQYLAAAGVGTIGVVDDDTVSLSNLQRQILFGAADVGESKVAAVARAVARLNPDVRVETHAVRLDTGNAAALVGAYDLVADGTDNFATRLLVNDACFFAGRPLVSAAIAQFEGQIATFRPDRAAGLPCYRCLVPEVPPMARSCAEAGVLGAMAGVVGTLQAVEVMKELLGVGRSLAGRLMIYDALRAETRTLKLPADPDCPLCGHTPRITGLRPAA